MQNPLDTLQVFHNVKELRNYYFKVIHNHLPADLRRTCGMMLLNELFTSVRHLAVVVSTRNAEIKVKEIEDFLTDFALIVDKIEFLVDAKAISFKQADYLYREIMDIEGQMGAFRKTIKQFVGKNPQSTE